MLDDLGLAAALGWLAREIARPTGLRIQVQADDLPPDLPDEHRTCVFRMVQEALHNVQRHANANTVEITVRASDAWLSVTVQDDGRGFQHTRAHGLGLTGMHERAESLGGSVKITSSQGKGTLIEVALPLPQRLQGLPAGSTWEARKAITEPRPLRERVRPLGQTDSVSAATGADGNATSRPRCHINARLSSSDLRETCNPVSCGARRNSPSALRLGSAHKGLS
jgi:hypothetical protein